MKPLEQKDKLFRDFCMPVNLASFCRLFCPILLKGSMFFYGESNSLRRCSTLSAGTADAATLPCPYLRSGDRMPGFSVRSCLHLRILTVD